MNDIVERLRDLRFRNDLQDEAADTIEALRRQVETWSIRAEAHKQACIASELALAAMTAERDGLRQEIGRASCRERVCTTV